MSAPPAQSISRAPAGLLPAVIIALTALLAYHNSFGVPLQFDDLEAIGENPSIRSLWLAWLPPPGMTVSGRPLLNLSFALNYAISGEQLWSYHALNLLIHIGAGLALFGCVHRTLLLPSLRTRFGAAARPLALAIALLWTLHPLQTESVTYLVQRAESLMGLFYLLTFYCYLRSTDAVEPVRWQAWAVASCALGMATKEVMVTAPLLVFLHDRAFVAGSFRDAWRQRRGFHFCLAATWVILSLLVASAGGNRNGTVGPGVNATVASYFPTQFEAVGHYLKLALWPHPLVFEYGWFQVESLGQLLPWLLLVAPLALLTLYALWRHPRLGFLGGWFFGILALTSIMPGTTQMIVEHRAYLSLAAILAGVVLAVYVWLGRRSFGLFAGLALVLGGLTVIRNDDYRTRVSLWEDTVQKRPDNARAQATLGILYEKAGRVAEALQRLQLATRLDPKFPEAWTNQGDILVQLKRHDEAIKAYQTSLALKPNRPVVLNNLGNACLQAGRATEGIAYLEAAVQLGPELADARFNLAAALTRAGRAEEALPHYAAYLRLRPDDAEAQFDYGMALFGLGRRKEAFVAFATTVRLRPEHAEAHNNLGVIYAQAGRPAEALKEFREAVRIDPSFTNARENAEAAARELGQP